MPITVNGIGSRYVGRQNVLVRNGACAFCGRSAQLSSYDTREWFVVVFVPLIPLTRYHILDDCSRCRKHRRLVAAVWQQHQAQARLDAESLLRARPGDPRAAIEAHAKLAAFQLGEDAAQLEAALVNQFPGNADVLVYLAQLAQAAGRKADALHSFERAHLADPSNGEAREGLALHAALDGRPERGLELLVPVLESGTLQHPGPARALATALLGAQRHEDARRVLAALLQRFPGLANDKSFGRELARCEKALGVPRTKLAANRRALAKWIAAGVAAAAALIGVLVADAYAGRHIKLYVVSSVAGRLKVEIPGAETLDFARPGKRELELPAGEYRAQISGPLKREVAFTLRSFGWPRFLDGTVNVLDASGTSLLSLEHATYSAHPGRDAAACTILFGEDFRHLQDVDYAFEPFPNSLEVSSEHSSERKTRVDFVDAPAVNVVYGLISMKDARQALALATWNFGGNPQAGDALDGYLAAVHAAHAEKQAASYLAPRLEARPVELPVHRAWISLLSGPDGRARAGEKYRDLHQREPHEPAWPYLLACLSSRVSERRPLLEEALTDEAPSEIWRALAETQAADGAWELVLDSARAATDRAEQGDRSALALRFDALAALGRDDALGQDLATWFQAAPCDTFLGLRFFEHLPAETSEAELGRQLTEWQKRADKECGGIPGEEVVGVHAWCEFLRGDIAPLERLVRPGNAASLRWLLASALADQGRLLDTRDYVQGKGRCEIEAYDALALALACRAGGNDALGAAWEARALVQLDAGVDSDVARLLSGTRRGVADEALDLALPPWRKAIVLALLSLADEDAEARLLEQAVRLQSRPTFPRRVIEKLASKVARR